MTNEYDFLKKQRYEYYKGTTEIMDNEVNELVEDVIDVLNQKAYNINELLKIKQFQAQRIAELEEQLKNAIVLKPDRYVIVNNWWKKKKYGIAKVHQQVLDSYSIQTGYMGDVSPCLEYGEFATLEEAQAKLKELKGENE